MSQNHTDPSTSNDADEQGTEPRDLGPWVVSADVVRAELEEAADLHHLDEESAARIIALSDAQIHEAIQNSVRDWHWEMFDDLRREAIAVLVK